MDNAGDLQIGIKKLRDEITCAVCKDNFQDPKLLPCCHYYCKKCIVQLACREQPFPCPECRKDTFLAQDSVDDLPTAFFVNRFRSAISALEKCDKISADPGGISVAICDQCRSVDAVASAFCHQCAQLVCEFCVQAHQRQKIYANHLVVKIEEVKLRRDAARVPTDVEVRQVTMTCKKHNEMLKVYCFSCEQLICFDCTVIDHKDHEYEFLKACAPKIKQSLGNSLVPLKKAQKKLVEAKSAIDHVKRSSRENQVLLEDEIQSISARIVNRVKEHQCKLLDRVHTESNTKQLALADQEKSLDANMERLQDVVSLVTKVLSSGSEEEVVSISKQLQDKVSLEMARIDALDLDPVVEPFSDILKSCEEQLMKAISESTKVVPLAVDVKKCIVKGSGAETADTNTPTQVLLATFGPNNQSFNVECQSIGAELESLFNGSVLQVDVVQRSRATYQLSYIPKVRGQHRLSITINDHHIAGSPFPVYVNCPPSQLGQPVRVIKGLGIPTDLAIDRNDNLLVASMSVFSNSYLYTLTKDGEKVKNAPRRHFCEIRGIAIDKNGCFLVTYMKGLHLISNEVAKYDQNWKLLRLKCFKPMVGKVKIGPDHKYYICETYNVMIIKVKYRGQP